MEDRPHSTGSTELDLVVACCRHSFAETDEDGMTELARGARWAEVVRLARRHRVQGLVWQALESLGMPLGDEAQALRAEAASIAEHNLRAAAQSARMLAAFEDAGLPILFVKGLTLGQLAYQRPLMKMSWDIDILVPADGAKDAAKVLRSLGYRLVVPEGGRLGGWHDSRKESVWSLPGGLPVDMHTRLADSPALIPSITVESPGQHVDVARGITLPTLAHDELFAYLAVHGAWAAWFRLKWIADFAASLAGRDDREIERLYRRSRELGAGRTAAQALLLAASLFGTGRGSRLLVELGSDRWHRFLCRAALAQLTGPEPTESAGGTLMIHFAQLFLRPELGYTLGEIRRQAREAIENRR
jgi:hypothetical protein